MKEKQEKGSKKDAQEIEMQKFPPSPFSDSEDTSVEQIEEEPAPVTKQPPPPPPAPETKSWVRAKIPAKVTGEETSKTSDYQSKLNEALGEKYAVEGGGDADNTFFTIVKKDEKQKPLLMVKNNEISAQVKLTGNEELTKDMLTAAQKLYGNKLIIYSSDPAEKAYIQTIACKIDGLNVDIHDTESAYNNAKKKASEPKANTTISVQAETAKPELESKNKVGASKEKSLANQETTKLENQDNTPTPHL